MATRALPGGRAAVRAVRAAPRVPSARLLHASGAAANTPRSPFQVFVETLKEELTKSREFQDNLKQLQGESGKFQDTETMRRAREAYERARIVTSIKHNPRLQRAAEQLRKSGGQVGGAVSAALRQMEDSELMRSLSAMSDRLRRQIEESTAPMRNTEVYKAFAETLTEAFDDGGSALRHYFDERVDDRTARRLRREARLRKIGREPPTEDVEAVPTPEDPVVAAAAGVAGVAVTAIWTAAGTAHRATTGTSRTATGMGPRTAMARAFATRRATGTGTRGTAARPPRPWTTGRPSGHVGRHRKSATPRMCARPCQRSARLAGGVARVPPPVQRARSPPGTRAARSAVFLPQPPRREVARCNFFCAHVPGSRCH